VIIEIHISPCSPFKFCAHYLILFLKNVGISTEFREEKHSWIYCSIKIIKMDVVPLIKEGLCILLLHKYEPFYLEKEQHSVELLITRFSILHLKKLKKNTKYFTIWKSIQFENVCWKSFFLGKLLFLRNWLFESSILEFMLLNYSSNGELKRMIQSEGCGS